MRQSHLVSLALIVALLTGALTPGLAASQVQDGATMTVLKGSVALVRGDGTSVQPAPSGTLVRAGDEIRTLTKAGALITFFTGTEIEMGEDTILVVERIAAQGATVEVSLKQVYGATLHRVQSLTSPGSSYRVDAGGAVALIRGTEFLIVGPTSNNQVFLICQRDCDARSTFAGQPLGPNMGYFVEVDHGKVVTEVEGFKPDFSAGVWNAGAEAATMGEQAQQGDTRGTPPGQVPTGQRNEAAAAADRAERSEAEDEKPPPTTSGGSTSTTSFLVTSTADLPDANPGDGICAAADGSCTLRAALQEANILFSAAPPASDSAVAESERLLDSGDLMARLPLVQAGVNAAVTPTGEVILPAGIIVLRAQGAEDNLGLVGDFDVLRPMVIRGAGVGQTVLDGNGTSRIFDLFSNVTLKNMTIRNGNSGTNSGGAIFVRQPFTATLENVAVFGSTGRNGGGISSDANTSIFITNSVFEGNTASTGDGGAVNALGALTAVSSSFSGNTAGSDAGAINAQAVVSMADVIITNNTAANCGGGLSIQLGGNANLTGLTVTNNASSTAPVAGSGGGGGICIGNVSTAGADRVTITNSTISNNITHNARSGGGIVAAGIGSPVLAIANSTIANNQSTNFGGGIHATANVTFSMTESVVRNNTAQNGGGVNVNGLSLLTNVTFLANVATNVGGAFRADTSANAVLTNLTFSANSAAGGGAAIRRTGGTVTVRNTIVGAQTLGNACTGGLTSAGSNIDAANTCAFAGAGDLPNTDPLLATLQDNGGPTRTIAINPGSPAIDSGNNTFCPPIDQRGVTRPRDGDGNGTAICDRGAFER